MDYVAILPLRRLCLPPAAAGPSGTSAFKRSPSFRAFSSTLTSKERDASQFAPLNGISKQQPELEQPLRTRRNGANGTTLETGPVWEWIRELHITRSRQLT
jgi:hypothetical protein